VETDSREILQPVRSRQLVLGGNPNPLVHREDPVSPPIATSFLLQQLVSDMIRELLICQTPARPVIAPVVDQIQKQPPETLANSATGLDQHKLSLAGLEGWLDDQGSNRGFLRDRDPV